MRAATTGRLLLCAICLSLPACGPSGTGSGPAGGGTGGGGGPTDGGGAVGGGLAWGFFDYTRDFVDALANARLGRATGVVWTLVEPQPGSGLYDWSGLDLRIGNAQTFQTDAVIVLKTGNGSAFSEPACFQAVEAAAARGDLPNGPSLASCPLRVEMESAWAQMVAAVAERYDGDGDRDMPGLSGTVRIDIEIENEAADPQFWDYGESDRTLAADRYLRLLELSYQAKQSADPGTQVILAGVFQPSLLASCDAQPSQPVCSRTILQSLAFTKRTLDRPDLFDAVDLHFFGYYHFEPGLVDSGFQWAVNEMQRRGYQRPVHALEWTGSSLLHVVLEGHVDEFAGYFPFWADFGDVESFSSMYAELDRPENAVYREWFEAEQAKEFGKFFSNLLTLGVGRLVHVQYSDLHAGSNWDNAFWNWQGIIKYVGGAPVRKPSYYTFNLLSDRLFGFTGARRIEQSGAVRLYEFSFASKRPGYVLWTDGAQALLDLSSVFGSASVRVTHLVTELDALNGPVVLPDETVSPTAVPAGDIPVLLEAVE